MNNWRKLFRFSLLNMLAAFVPLGMLLWVLDAWLRQRMLNAAEAFLLSLMALSSMIGTMLGGGSGFMIGLIVGLALFVLGIPLLAILFPPT
jgi:hypothetical protein